MGDAELNLELLRPVRRGFRDVLLGWTADRLVIAVKPWAKHLISLILRAYDWEVGIVTVTELQLHPCTEQNPCKL